jgi:hypothetical protein
MFLFVKPDQVLLDHCQRQVPYQHLIFTILHAIFRGSFLQLETRKLEVRKTWKSQVQGYQHESFPNLSVQAEKDQLDTSHYGSDWSFIFQSKASKCFEMGLLDPFHHFYKSALQIHWHRTWHRETRRLRSQARGKNGPRNMKKSSARRAEVFFRSFPEPKSPLSFSEKVASSDTFSYYSQLYRVELVRAFGKALDLNKSRRLWSFCKALLARDLLRNA